MNFTEEEWYGTAIPESTRAWWESIPSPARVRVAEAIDNLTEAVDSLPGWRRPDGDPVHDFPEGKLGRLLTVVPVLFPQLVGWPDNGATQIESACKSASNAAEWIVELPKLLRR